MTNSDALDTLLKLSQAGANIASMLTQRGTPAYKLGLSLHADLEIIYERTLGQELASERKTFFAHAVEENQRRTKRLMERVGPKLWGKFHRDALQSDDSVEAAAPVIEGLLAAIPCGECKASFRAILEENPYTGGREEPGAFFDHSVLLHNQVNRKLGKPEITLDLARRIWK